MEAEERAIEMCRGLESYAGARITSAIVAGIANDIRAAETEAWNEAIRAFADKIANLVDGPGPVDRAIRKMTAEIGLRLIKKTS